MNPYQEFIRKTAENIREAEKLPLGGFSAPVRERCAPDAPAGLIFAPHPDDECINGGLPLRLAREAGFRIINVPVTLGSDRQRRSARRVELENACRYLGFEVEFIAPDGFTQIDPAGRQNQPQNWASAVAGIASILLKFRPQIIFFPHSEDLHPTHCGTNLLVRDALLEMPDDFVCLTVENEFWQASDTPNTLVELDQENVGELVAALSFHTGEVRRNPYHLTLPAWLIDNVRRGSEIIGSTGGAAPDFLFGVLNQFSLFQKKQMQPAFSEGRFLSAETDLGAFLKTLI